MESTVLFQYILISIILTFSRNIYASICYKNGNILQCNTTGIDTIGGDSNNLDSIDTVDIIYYDDTTLDVELSSINLIRIRPYDENAPHTLQISSIETTAARIEIQIHLSQNQIWLPLFTSTNFQLPSTTTLNINVKQTYSDASNFKIFANSALPTMNLAKYELIFNNSTSNSGSLSFPDLIRGLKSVSSLFIFGNKHLLKVDSFQMPSSLNIRQLILRNLRLQDQILYNIMNLNEYIIEECEYNQGAQFLQSNQAYNISLIMKNNNPLDLVLPNGINAFNGLQKYISITLIEPKLNSSCLKTIKGSKPGAKYLTLDLGNYTQSDFSDWKGNSPIVWYLTIRSIQDLNIFPSKFFNSIDSLQKLILQGTFTLKKSHLCIFVGINVPDSAELPLITLESPQNPQNWDRCADTYIKAINARTMADVKCSPDDTCEDCVRWSMETAQCSLVQYENSCSDSTLIRVKPFYYNNSYLYYFFKNQSWLDRPANYTLVPKQDSVNMAAIIGAICGLLIAMIVLGLTIFCICRYRQKDKNFVSSPAEKYKYSSDDPSHVSIATSKTSQSSRAALQKSFFPPIQPNDEIAPPLYTAPSESARSTSVYNHPTAPPAPRDSISTHTTHVYETVDS
ncbi:hypothetical protein I4U23_010032 [Adineta vaga]|nr:hypothetical protein I4U23_010032 [Adineta vaga]